MSRAGKREQLMTRAGQSGLAIARASGGNGAIGPLAPSRWGCWRIYPLAGTGEAVTGVIPEASEAHGTESSKYARS